MGLTQEVGTIWNIKIVRREETDTIWMQEILKTETGIIHPKKQDSRRPTQIHKSRMCKEGSFKKFLQED